MACVIVLSDTKQEFNGEFFYLCGNYFQHKGKRLHRAVWEYFNGEIPNGFHIHHIDGNRANNRPENLRLMQGNDHCKIHAEEESRIENGKRAIRFAIAKAPEWHKSQNGQKWHSKHAKEYWSERKPEEYICTMCGEKFMTRHVYKNGNRFCGPNCRAKYGRKKRAGLL